MSSDRLVYKLLELVEQKTLRRGGNSMKKLRSIGCLIVLILSVLNLKIALGQGEENLNNDQDVTLEVDGGFLTLMIPAEYQYQTVELTELERYPFSYTFMNEETGIRFTVYSTLHSQKEQSHFLKKLYDKSNRYIVFEDVLIGGYTLSIQLNKLLMIMDFLFVQIMDIAINSNTLYRMIGFKTKYRKMPSLFYQLWSFTKPPYLINWEWRIGMPIRA